MLGHETYHLNVYVCVIYNVYYSNCESTFISFHINENKTCSSLLDFVYIYVTCCILKFCFSRPGICTGFCRQQFYLCMEHLGSSLSNLIQTFYKQHPLGSPWPPYNLLEPDITLPTSGWSPGIMFCLGPGIFLSTWKHLESEEKVES